MIRSIQFQPLQQKLRLQNNWSPSWPTRDDTPVVSFIYSLIYNPN